MSETRSSLGISKPVKDRLQNLNFVRKTKDEKIIEILMDFYEAHKPEFKKWQKKKNLGKK